MTALQAHLDRLRVPHAGLQQAAVAGVFETLSNPPGLSPATRQSAIAQCLGCEHLAAVEAAVPAVLQADAAQLGSPPQDLLLTALAVAGPSTAAPLADGLLQLFRHQPDSGGSSAAAAWAAWRGHPLSKALLANTAAAQPLLLGVTRLLTQAAEAADRGALDRLLAALLPFLSLVLLDPSLQQQQPMLAPQLHSALARVACCCRSTNAQQALFRLLISRLPGMRLEGSERQAAAIAAVSDVLDVLESCGEEPDSATVCALAASLVGLCHEAASQQAAALVQQLLAGLSHLASYWPHLLLPHAADLGLLLAQQQAALGSAETRALLSLLGRLLQHAAESGGDGAAAAGVCAGSLQPRAELSALLMLPLLQQVAFSSSADVKQWAAHVLALLRQLGSANSASPPSKPLGAKASAGRLHGAAAAAQAAQQVLHDLWQRPLEARHWLASLQLALAMTSTTPSSSGGGGGCSSRAVRELLQLGSGTLLVLCALLQHPAGAVQRSALQAAVSAVEAAPLLGLSLLPLLVQQLQRQVELFLSGKHHRPSRLLLELLRALPAMGRHPATLPFVLRTLQQLLSTGAPDALQAVGLRLLCRLWQASGGRAYQQLRAAVIGFAPPGKPPSLALRVARAECLRDICTAEPDKAVELVGLLQECLADREAPAVQAIGLDCIALLCEADVLEFYAAWRVVHRQLPRLPEHPGAAAAWVRLLGSGGLDASVQPDAATAIVDALWLAAAHEEPQVRHQAYASLAAFRFETLEAIDALRPLWHYAALLHGELQQQEQQAGLARHSKRRQQHCQQALAECEALVQAALAHEHATRRRQAAVGATAGRERGGASMAAGSGAGGAASLAHRLQTVLPKQLLGGSAASAAGLLQRLPDLPPAAVLYFYAPSPPPASSSKAAAAAAARHAAADYQAAFAEVLRQQAAAGSAAEDAGAAAEALAAWSAFLRRWLAAVRAAAKEQQTDAQQAAADAAMQVWATVREPLESSTSTPAVAASAAWAAAALCGCTPQPLLPLVTAVHGTLGGIAEGKEQHAAAVRRAAMAALGALAEAVRVTLGGPQSQQLVHMWQQQLAQQPAATAADAAAAATGLGLACKALASSAGDLPGATQPLVQGGLASLLGALCTAWPAGAGSTAAAAAADGLQLPAPNAALPPADELLPAAAAALGAALPAAARLLGLPSLLRSLHQQLAARLPQQAAGGSAMPCTAALCSLLQAVTAAGFSSSALAGSSVSSSLRLLLSLAGGSESAPGVDGRAVGAAAAAAGSLLASVLQQGFSAGAAEQEPAAVLQRLLAVPEAAGRLPHVGAAKCGAAAGVVALLLSSAVDPSSGQYKAAVAALDDLALRDSDPRVRRACALPLASLCYAIKRSGGFGGAAPGADTGGAAGSSKGLQQLPAEGALRPLLESLLEGHWALPEESSDSRQQPLGPADAAAILRCAASAARLPAMSYGLLCNRLQRSLGEAGAEGAAEVQQALAAFAAAHGSQQQYQLGSYAADLLSSRSMQAAVADTQRQLLLLLPQLLAAVPEAEAAWLLQQAVRHVSMHSAATPRDTQQQRRLLLQLLRSLAQLLAGSSRGASGSGSVSASQGIAAAAAGAVQEVLLAPGLLPPPRRYPLQLSAVARAGVAADAGAGGDGSGEGEQLERLPALQQRCWAAALRCLQLLPQPQRDALLQHPSLAPAMAAFAAASLVTSGLLDGRVLQHPRNIVLCGLGRGPDSSSGTPAGSRSEQQQQQQDEGRMVSQFVGCAVAALPAGQQQQWVLDVLDACKACADPAGAFELAACIVSSCAAAAAAESSAQLAVDHALPAGSAAQALPATLPVLLASPAWQRSSASVALLLQRLTLALQHLASTQLPAMAGAAMADWMCLLCRCLLAVRHAMPADSWPVLASLL